MVTGLIVLITVTTAVRTLLEYSVPVMFAKCCEAYMCIKEAVKTVMENEKKS